MFDGRMGGPGSKDESHGWSVVLKMIDGPAGSTEEPVLPSAGRNPAPEPIRDEPTVIDGRLPKELEESQPPTEERTADASARGGRERERSARRSSGAHRSELPKRTAPADQTLIDAPIAAPSSRSWDPRVTPAPVSRGRDAPEDPTPAPELVPDDRTEPVRIVGGDRIVDELATIPADAPLIAEPLRPRLIPTGKTGREPKPAVITLSDPSKRGSGEVRVTAASESVIARVSAGQLEPMLDSPPIPVHMLRELGPVETMREAEMTVLDLAAQLGLAPEPSPADPATEDAARAGLPAPGKSDPAARLPAPSPTPPALEEQGAKVAELLEEERPRPGARGGPKMRGETMLEHLPRWLFLTEGAAKLIPVLIGAFVMFSSVAVVIMLFSGSGSGATEHVTLRFLPVTHPSGEAPNPFLAAPIFTIETEPEGVLVVLDRKILGQTPLTFELPMPAERVGIELTSPYYETWVGEALREPTGEMRMRAKLKKRR